MDAGDVVGVVFVLLIVAVFVLPWVGRFVSPGAGTDRRAISAGPKSFVESGGYRPFTPRPARVDVPIRVEQSRQGVFEDLEVVLPERGEERLAREEALEQDPSEDRQQRDDERTRRRPIVALTVLTPETETAGQIRLQFQNRQAVRTAIIMREVLDRPIALREEC